MPLRNNGQGGERLGLRLDFLTVMDEAIREAEVRLGAGVAKDFTAYQSAVAQIGAFKKAKGLFESVYRRYVEVDEMDDLAD